MEQEMWLARDKDGTLWLFTQKPSKLKDRWAGILGTSMERAGRMLSPSYEDNTNLR